MEQAAEQRQGHSISSSPGDEGSLPAKKQKNMPNHTHDLNIHVTHLCCRSIRNLFMCLI